MESLSSTELRLRLEALHAKYDADVRALQIQFEAARSAMSSELARRPL